MIRPFSHTSAITNLVSCRLPKHGCKFVEYSLTINLPDPIPPILIRSKRENFFPTKLVKVLLNSFVFLFALKIIHFFNKSLKRIVFFTLELINRNEKIQHISFLLLSDKNRTSISLFFCLVTKEPKKQVSIEAVRRKFLSDRYTKRVYALAYKRQALFGIGSASKFSSRHYRLVFKSSAFSSSLRQSRPRSAEPLKSF
jgi:hypothetical protein